MKSLRGLIIFAFVLLSVIYFFLGGMSDVWSAAKSLVTLAGMCLVLYLCIVGVGKIFKL